MLFYESLVYPKFQFSLVYPFYMALHSKFSILMRSFDQLVFLWVMLSYQIKISFSSPRSWINTFAYGYPIDPTPFVEQTIFFHWIAQGPCQKSFGHFLVWDLVLCSMLGCTYLCVYNLSLHQHYTVLITIDV